MGPPSSAPPHGPPPGKKPPGAKPSGGKRLSAAQQFRLKKQTGELPSPLSSPTTASPTSKRNGNGGRERDGSRSPLAPKRTLGSPVAQKSSVNERAGGANLPRDDDNEFYYSERGRRPSVDSRDSRESRDSSGSGGSGGSEGSEGSGGSGGSKGSRGSRGGRGGRRWEEDEEEEAYRQGRGRSRSRSRSRSWSRERSGSRRRGKGDLSRSRSRSLERDGGRRGRDDGGYSDSEEGWREGERQDEYDDRRKDDVGHRRSTSDDEFGSDEEFNLNTQPSEYLEDEYSDEEVKEEEGGGKDRKLAAGGSGGVEESTEAILKRRQDLRAKGMSPAIFNGLQIPLILRELHQFIRSPPEEGLGTQVRCFIERSKSGTNKLAPVYTLYADHEDGSGRQLLCARKLLKSRESHYVISTNVDDLYKKRGERSRHYMGKLRANAGGTEYTLFDGGASAKEMGLDGDSDEEKSAYSEDARNPVVLTSDQKKNLRRELCCIHYEVVSKKDKSVRKMTACIPAVKGVGGNIETEVGSKREQANWQPLLSRDGMTPSFARIRYQKASNVLLSDRLLCLHQRESKYDPLSSCLVDFKERANCASVKNFQMIKSQPQDETKLVKYYGQGFAGFGEEEGAETPSPVLLQMGKVGKHCFNMDFQYPLNMLVAFGICLSRFDTGTI